MQEAKRKRPHKTVPSSAKEGTNAPVSSDEESVAKRVRCGRCQSCLNKEDCKSCYRCVSTVKIKYKNGQQKGCVMRECLMVIGFIKIV